MDRRRAVSFGLASTVAAFAAVLVVSTAFGFRGTPAEDAEVSAGPVVETGDAYAEYAAQQAAYLQAQGTAALREVERQRDAALQAATAEVEALRAEARRQAEAELAAQQRAAEAALGREIDAERFRLMAALEAEVAAQRQAILAAAAAQVPVSSVSFAATREPSDDDDDHDDDDHEREHAKRAEEHDD